MRRAILLPTVTVLALPVAAHGQDTRTGMVITGAGGYSNSPFAEASGGTATGYFSLDLVPYVDVQTERSTLSVTGRAHLQAYTSRYPVTDSYRVSVDDRTRASERLALFGHIDIATQVLGSDDQDALGTTTGLIAPAGGLGFTNGTPTGNTADTGTGTGVANGGTTGAGSTGTTTALPVDTSGALFNDIGLLGSRVRRRSVYVTGGGQYALSERDAFDLNGFVDVARYSRFGDRSDYNGYGSTMAFSRRVAADVRAGVQGSISRFDYRGARGRTDVVSLEGTLSGRIGEYWVFSGSLGASIIDGTSIGTRNQASASGSLQLCREGLRDMICVLGSRQARATGFNGAQYITTGDLSWRHRLTERSSVSADASYIQQGGLTRLNGAQNQYLRTAVTLDRDITERLRGLVSARYRRVFGGSTDHINDYGGQIGVSYRLGAMR